MPHCIYEDPKDILTFFDIQDDRLLTDGIVLIFFFFGMRLLAFLALKIKVLSILYENTGNGFFPMIFFRCYFLSIISGCFIYRNFERSYTLWLFWEKSSSGRRFGHKPSVHRERNQPKFQKYFNKNRIQSYFSD